MIIYVLNVSELTNNPSSYRCTMHGDIKLHCMRDSTLAREVKLECTYTLYQSVDIRTKALAEDHFSEFRAMLLR